MKLSFDIQRFMKTAWQKAPRFLPGGVADMEVSICGDELAGLSLEPAVESRLVQFDGTTWKVRTGPFEEQDFQRLPDTGWTLLVQDCEKHTDLLDDFAELFQFLPRWRLDDLMVSYAVPGGSVGPHTDEYDVFLIQLEGRRHWQLATQFDPSLRPDSDLAILANFQAESSYMATPGDILYLPPNVAHYGVADTHCLTLSIGLRAPTPLELLNEVLTASGVAEFQSPFRSRFRDPDRLQTRYFGELTDEDLAALRAQLHDAIDNDESFPGWVLSALSQPKPQLESLIEPDGESTPHLRISPLRLTPYTTALWRIAAKDIIEIALNGQRWHLPATLIHWVEALCRGHRCALPVEVSSDIVDLVGTWMELGFLELDE